MYIAVQVPNLTTTFANRQFSKRSPHYNNLINKELDIYVKNE